MLAAEVHTRNPNLVLNGRHGLSVEIGIYHAVLGFLYLTIVCSTTVAVLLFRRVPHIWKLPTCVINTVAVGAIVFSFGRTVVFWLLAWIFVVVALWAGQ